MVFSSNLFLFWFLPPVLTLHYLLPARLRNPFLFAASTFFYMWGSGPVVFVFLAGIALSYYAGAVISRSPPRWAKLVLMFTLGAELSVLLYYKYLNFVSDQVSSVLRLAGVNWHRGFDITLPIGVSFFVFQAMTYPIEIYTGRERPAPRLTDVGAYLAMFAHLIAGPIVRYSDISTEVRQRTIDLDDLFAGLQRFASGLAKKVLVANHVGVLADQMFALPRGELTPVMAWLGVVAYAFQIYFDFSGYSDMAIGLARFLGFHFPENFNHPYRATSVTDFWRRWHMTLSRWFRDFVYVPLGGNRKGSVRTHVNLFLVFFLCGLWHGASWNFVLWGMFHGALLVIERFLKKTYGLVPSGLGGAVATCLFVFVAWVPFRAPDLATTTAFFSAMAGFGPGASHVGYFPLAHYLTRNVVFYLVVGAALSWVPFERARRLTLWNAPAGAALQAAWALTLLFVSAAILSTVAFNPFIYFRF